MGSKRSKRGVTRKSLQVEYSGSKRYNDAFADCPELNNVDNESIEWSTVSKDGMRMLMSPVTPKSFSASGIESRKPCKNNDDETICFSDSAIYSTPKSTLRMPCNFQEIARAKSCTSKKQCHSVAENKLSKSESLNALTSYPRTEESYKAVLDGANILKEIKRRMKNSKRSLSNSSDFTCEQQSGGKVVSPLCMTSNSGNNVNISERAKQTTVNIVSPLNTIPNSRNSLNISKRAKQMSVKGISPLCMAPNSRNNVNISERAKQSSVKVVSHLCTTPNSRNSLNISQGSISKSPKEVLNEKFVNNVESPVLSKPVTNLSNGSEKTSDVAGSSRQVQDEWDDLPPTQPVAMLLLKGVVAYVEVRSGNENRSFAVKDQLLKYGARVSKTFTREVTHVVFNEGLMSTYKKAIKWKVPLVSVMWIEECKKAREMVSERLFPPYGMEQYESPNPLKKMRKMRSFQPDFENVIEEKIEKRRRKWRNDINTKEISNCDPDSETGDAQREYLLGPKWVQEVANGNGMVRALINVAKIGPDEFQEIINRPSSPEESECGETSTTPLAVRLLRKLMSPKPRECENSSLIKQNTCDKENSAIDDHTNKNGTKPYFFETTNGSLGGKGGKNIGTVSQNELNLMESQLEEKSAKFSDNFPRMNALSPLNVSGISRLNRTFSNESAPDEGKLTAGASQVSESNNTQGMETSQFYKYNSQEGKDKSVLSVNNSTVSRKRKLLSLKQDDSKEIVLSPLRDENNLNIMSIQNPHADDAIKLKKRRVSKRYSKSCAPVHMKLTQCSHSSQDIWSSNQQERDSDSELVQGEICIKDKSSMSLLKRKSLRRSSFDFITIQRHISSQLTSHCPDKDSTLQLPSIVCTSLHSEEIDVIVSIVKKLGRYVVEAQVSARTTHVVTKEPRRTLKFLKGLARGCWLVKQNWVFKSLEEGKWIDEDEFELTEFSPAVQKYRIEKLSFGPTYKPDLFGKCGPIFVSSKNISVPCNDVAELVTLCGGQVTPSIRTASIVIGRATDQKDVECVTAAWILDSISLYRLAPVEKYLITSTG